MRFTACLLLAVIAATSAVSYHGYKVVTVTPRTLSEVQLVEDTVQKLQLQQWTHRTGIQVPNDILVPPSLQYVFLTGLRSKGIPATIKIQDVQKLIDAQVPHLGKSRSSRAFDHTQYHTVEEIYAILEGVEQDNPSLVSSYIGATTYEGREIRVIKVSGDGSDTRPVIWIDCGIHAREWVSSATCQYILDQLTSGYGTDSDVTALVDTYDFHIMPVANPDGYAFTWTNDRLWRKNRVFSGGAIGCYGVDPNRNFDSDFGGPGTSDSPCSDIYHGVSAFSEFESQAIRDSVLALGDRVNMFITLHAYSQLWMTPYGYTEELPVDYSEQIRVGEIGVKALEAVHGTVYQLGNIANIIYMAAGGSSDWAYDGAGVKYAYALELRDTGNFGFLLPPQQIIPTAEETLAGIMAAINALP